MLYDIMLIYVNCAAYAETFVRGLPFAPSHGRWETAAEIIFDDPGVFSFTHRGLLQLQWRGHSPTTARKVVMKVKKFAASADE